MLMVLLALSRHSPLDLADADDAASFVASWFTASEVDADDAAPIAQRCAAAPQGFAQLMLMMRVGSELARLMLMLMMLLHWPCAEIVLMMLLGLLAMARAANAGLMNSPGFSRGLRS